MSLFAPGTPIAKAIPGFIQKNRDNGEGWPFNFHDSLSRPKSTLCQRSA